jgi:hypothetical protein
MTSLVVALKSANYKKILSGGNRRGFLTTKS